MSSGAESGRRWAALGAVSLGTFMATLDASVVNLALPALSADLGAGLAEVEWVVLSYLLVLVALLLNVGRIGDLFGRRRVYVAGLLVFGAASGACAAAGSVGVLVAARVVQAIGSAMMASLGAAILVAVFPAAQRGRVLGLVGLAVSAGLASGPAVGGLVLDVFSWRWLFLPNVPIAVVTAWAAIRSLPADTGERRARLDLAGSILLAVTLGGLMFALSHGGSWGFVDPRTLGLVGGSVVLGAVFVFREWRAADPVLDLRLFLHREFAGAAAAGFFVFVAVGAVNLVLPFFLVETHGLEASAMGLVLTAFPVVMATVSPFSGWASDRLRSNRGLAASGAAVAAAAATLLGIAAPLGGPATVAACLGGLGLGVGLFQSPNNSALMGAVPRERLGTAGGLLATVRSLGMLVGNAVGGAVFLVAAPGAAEGAPAPAAAAAGLARASLVAAGAAVASCFASLLLRQVRRPGP